MKQHQETNKTAFLPTSRKEMKERGWDELDVLFISGDAYIDHPAFGSALLARLLEEEGFRVGILAQPDWKDPEAFRIMGRPRLFAAISAGAMDSMVNHYTAAKKSVVTTPILPVELLGNAPIEQLLPTRVQSKGHSKGCRQ